MGRKNRNQNVSGRGDNTELPDEQLDDEGLVGDESDDLIFAGDDDSGNEGPAEPLPDDGDDQGSEELPVDELPKEDEADGGAETPTDALPEPIVEPEPVAAVVPEVAAVEPEAQPEPEPEPEVVTDPKEQELRSRLAKKLPAGAAQAWTVAALHLYEKTGAWAPQTKNGNWVEDMRRGKNMKEWSSTELLDWAAGAIKTPRGVEDETIHNELFLRYRLPGNWTDKAAVEYVVNGVKPAYTSKGVLIEDRTRDNTSVNHWTYLELRSALLNEISSPHTVEELVDALRHRLNLNQSYSQEKLLESLADTPTEVSMDNAMLKAKLDEYKSGMTKNGANLTAASAGLHQMMLNKAIRQVLKRDIVGFMEGWQILLNWVNTEYATLFFPEKARFGWSHLTLAKAPLAVFEDLLTLLITTRDPIGRKEAAAIFPMTTMLRHIPDEAERQNLVQFYAQ